jgi:Ice-binding-like/Chitobiase/beta-hexosaminidase C-terminal domain/Bacterial Ig-like domain
VTTKVRIAVLLATAIIAGLAAQAALGYWTGAGVAGTGRGAAGAATLNQGAAPTAKETGSTTVTVSWGGSGLSNGVPADGYIVRRYDQATGVESTVGAGCAGVIAAVTCTETGTPGGNWEYAVTPLFGSNWRGPESVKSGAVNTGPGSVTLSRSLFGGTVAPLPAVVTGTVSNFGPNQAIAFFLDGSKALTGSPAQVGAGGGATISVTLPAGTADGPHTLSVRSATTEASSGILVDNTPPTIEVVVTPPPNAAGWNRTAPVEVGGIVDDGNGSGVAYAKYTEDGSDPKTSPTAQYETTGPVSVSTSKTLKFFIADNAGNESPVETQQIKIDTTEPLFTVGLTNVVGGAYIAPANLETGEPGDSFYRGAAAGSFRFLMTPIPLGGSPALAASFSELPSDSVGFSFDSSSVTTPVGGPFLSNVFSWVAGTTSTPSGTISLANEAGSTFGSAGAIHNDSTPPTGGSVDAEGLTGTGGRYSTSLELKLSLAKGTDSGSGLADGTGPSDLPDKLERASAPLTTSDGIANGSCGTYSAFVQVGANNPAASVVDTVPKNNNCYLYRYLVSDHVGNVATYTSPAIKVHTAAVTPPEPPPVALGEAENFAVLGASTVTSAGVSALTGNLGVSPGTAMTGFPPGTINGTMHSADAASNKAQAEVGVAYADAAGRSPATPIAAALGGLTLTRGVYKSASFTIGANLTLDAQNDPAAVFIFQAGSTLGTGASTRVNLINGAQACNVFWQVGSSATLGASSSFAGSILALTSISMGSGVAMNGRALAHNGAVTLIEDTVAAPHCAAPLSPTPTNATLTAVSGGASQSISGSTIFYNPNQSGSFSVESAASSSYVGTAQMTFPTIAGFAGGGAVASPSSGTTFRSTYSWSANGAAPSPGVQPISATNNAGQTATNPAAFTVVKDSSGPTGGSVDATGLVGTGGRYSTSTTLNLAFTPGTDSGSGLATSGAQLLRSSAALSSDGVTNGSCGTFGTYTQVGANDPSTPKTDTVPADRTCYRYEYVVSDKVGNQTTYVSPDVKVDATAPPAPVLTFSAPTNAYWSGTGSTVFYRPGAAGGGFQITAASPDTTAGISGYAFPTLPTGWSSTAGGTGVRSYTWSAANPVAPSGAQTVTATNYAGREASSTFTATPDSTAPTGGFLTYTNGYSVGSTVSISFTKGTDTISGLDPASGIIEGATATFAAGACGAFGSFSIVATNPLSGVSLPITSGTCYQYRYSIADNVGNRTTYTSSSITKADSVAPVDSLSLEGAVNASQSGNTIYYRGNVAGSFRIADAPTDTASGPASSTFPAIATTGWTHEVETISTPTGGPYISSPFSWTAGAANPTVKPVFSTDLAGKSSTNASILFASDIVPPSGGSIVYPNGVLNSASVPIATVNGSDGASGINTATTTIKRDVAPLTTATETCGTFPGTYATTVTLIGGADTSVTSGNCYRYEYIVSDKVGNQTVNTSASVAKIDTSGPQVTAIGSRQSSGSAGNGQIEVGDRLLLTFNQNLAVASVPTSISGATEAKPAFGNVTLTIPGITRGALDTGSAGYVLLPLTTTTFAATVTLANGGTATTVTITVTSVSGVLPPAGEGALVFAPATSLTDAGGNAVSVGLTTSANFKLF